MSTNRRGLRAAAFLFCLAASAATGALAQQAQPSQPSQSSGETVGPPVLKDFTLPGQRTTPPAPQPQPTQTEPPARTEPAATRPPQPRPQTAPAPAERPAARQTTPAEAPRNAAPAPAASPSTRPAPAGPAAPLPAEAAPAPGLDLPAAPAPAPAAEAPAAAEEGADWVFPAMALAFAGLAIFAFLVLSRRRRATPAAHGADAGAAAAAAPPRPVPQLGPNGRPVKPVRTPAPVPAVASGPRAWIELSIKADRAAATDKEALIQYELRLENAGEAVAGNLRISAKMFNATAEQDIAAFFKAPLHEKSGSPHVVVKPGGDLRLGGQVSMPLDEVRQIELQGRRLFIPVVAISVAYDWGENGAGRTSKSWIVGTQPQQEAEKMGAFRLDLGPRIYRSVGQREAQLVKV